MTMEIVQVSILNLSQLVNNLEKISGVWLSGRVPRPTAWSALPCWPEHEDRHGRGK